MNQDDSRQLEILAIGLMAAILARGDDGMTNESAVKTAARLIRLATLEQNNLLNSITRG